jgi:hypothetical protein
MLKQLKDPFDPKFLKWRVGATNKDKTKGIALPYIDSREVTKRLDDVCGLAGWQDRYIPVDGGFICELDIDIDGRWVTKSNAAGYTQVEAIKGGASDALKRAASTWGIARYLYYLPNVWVAIKPAGKSYALAEIPELPDWAKPSSSIERWEDVAELELDAMNANSDDDDNLTEVGIVVDIHAATNLKELGEAIAKYPADIQKAFEKLATERMKELQDASNS